jgi:hypothetical protein
MDRQHFKEIGTICVFVLRCRSKDVDQPRSTTSSGVDDAVLETSEPASETPNAEDTTSTTESVPETVAQQNQTHEAENEPAEAEPVESETPETEPPETEPDMFLGFMNDGAADHLHFGLDGEGPAPAEQKVWSWNTPHPPPPAGHGPSAPYVPGQPPATQNGPYGSYGYPSALPQQWQPGPAMSQDQSTAQRPQRHVHFNDQIPAQPSGYGAPGQPYIGQNPNGSVGQSQENSNPAHGQKYGGQSSNANVGQPQERPYPQQASGYPASGQPYSGQNLNTNAAQPQQQQGPQQPGYYGNPQQSELHHQAPGIHAHPPSVHGGAPNPQGQAQTFSLVPDPNYQPPLPNYVPQVPSYQPIGYGVPEFTGWPLAANYPAYAQPPWPGQHIPGPSYMTSSNLAPSYHPSHPYLYPQSTYPGGPTAPAPPPFSNHPGGGIWGPPPQQPGSQDPAKDENNQLDGQENHNQNNFTNAAVQSDDNNAQGWGNDDAPKPQASDSNWNNNNTSGSQTGNWNNTPDHPVAPTQDWTSPGKEAGQTNNADSSWNNDANTNIQGQDNTQGQDTWNTNANASTQVQDSWNSAPATAQPNDAAFTPPKQGSVAASLSPGRHLYGPHGPYYHQSHGPYLDPPHVSEDGALHPVVGEEPPYDVPADMPTTHQVKPGAGFMYAHKRRSPEYVDTLEEPYARFVFKYRTKGESIKSIESSFLLSHPRSSIHPACFSSRCTRSDLHHCGTPM